MRSIKILNRPTFLFTLLLVFVFSCKPTKQLTPPTTDDGRIEFVFMQANDVYEITPLSGGKVGGLARVGTVRQELLAENKNLLTVHAGDFLNPSLIGTLKYEGKKIKGKHMVEVMNAVGFDLTTFGNHEFDIKEHELQERMNESNFEWTTCNTFQVCGDRTYPFYKEKNGRKEFASPTYTWEISDADGTKIKVGIFGVTLPVNQTAYVHYDDFYASADLAIKDLSKTTDVVIGLTHLRVDQDMELAKRQQSVPLFMGGHDHDNMLHQVGNVAIAKADANVKSVYIHRLTYNTKTKKCIVKSELKKIHDGIPDYPPVAKVVDKWNKILMSKILDIVEHPNKVIYYSDVPLDGRESSIRHEQTNLGEIFVKSFYLGSKTPVDCAIINSGSVRLDDQITGNVTPIDIFRALPFGGKLVQVEMKGSLLKKLCDESESRHGNGAYLQRYKVTQDAYQNWHVSGKMINVNKTYTVAMSAFMLSGYDYKYLTRDHPDIVKIHEEENGEDLRLPILRYLENRK